MTLSSFQKQLIFHKQLMEANLIAFSRDWKAVNPEPLTTSTDLPCYHPTLPGVFYVSHFFKNGSLMGSEYGESEKYRQLYREWELTYRDRFHPFDKDRHGNLQIDSNTEYPKGVPTFQEWLISNHLLLEEKKEAE